jgi:hypothetical protein
VVAISVVVMEVDMVAEAATKETVIILKDMVDIRAATKAVAAIKGIATVAEDTANNNKMAMMELQGWRFVALTNRREVQVKTLFSWETLVRLTSRRSLACSRTTVSSRCASEFSSMTRLEDRRVQLSLISVQPKKLSKHARLMAEKASKADVCGSIPQTASQEPGETN